MVGQCLLLSNLYSASESLQPTMEKGEPCSAKGIWYAVFGATAAVSGMVERWHGSCAFHVMKLHRLSSSMQNTITAAATAAAAADREQAE